MAWLFDTHFKSEKEGKGMFATACNTSITCNYFSTLGVVLAAVRIKNVCFSTVASGACSLEIYFVFYGQPEMTTVLCASLYAFYNLSANLVEE